MAGSQRPEVGGRKSAPGSLSLGVGLTEAHYAKGRFALCKDLLSVLLRLEEVEAASTGHRLPAVRKALRTPTCDIVSDPRSSHRDGKAGAWRSEAGSWWQSPSESGGESSHQKTVAQPQLQTERNFFPCRDGGRLWHPWEPF